MRPKRSPAMEQFFRAKRAYPDAILFFRFGAPPSLEEVYRQVELMFCTFHQNLSSYAVRKYCQCQACLSAADLTLKVITHYGEFTDYKIKNFYKLAKNHILYLGIEFA